MTNVGRPIKCKAGFVPYDQKMVERIIYEGKVGYMCVTLNKLKKRNARR